MTTLSTRPATVAPPVPDATPPVPVFWRHKWLTLGAGLILLLLGLLAAGGPSKMLSGGFEDPGAQSTKATTALERLFPDSQPNLVILVTDKHGGAASVSARLEGDRVLRQLATEHGLHVIGSYYRTGQTQLRAKDGTAGLTLVHVDGNENASSETTQRVYDAIDHTNGQVTVTMGGITQINNETDSLVTKDLQLSESIALPLTLILLLFAFRSVIAALLPVGVSALSIVGSLGALFVLSHYVSVSIFAEQLVTTLGLGLAVDYTLLILTRYREERARGVPDIVALRTTMRTAGRTVLFSAAVLACTLATLMLFPLYFLRSSAYAGLAVLAFSLVGALILLPVVLLLLGDRLEKWSLPRRRSTVAPEQRRWGKISGAVMRRPIRYGLPVVILLLILAIPLGGTTFGVPDQRMLPKDAQSRVVQDTLDHQFDLTAVGAISIVDPDWGGDVAAVGHYAADLSRLPHVSSVQSAAGTYVAGRREAGPNNAAFVNGGATWLQVLTPVTSYSPAGSTLAHEVRAVAVPGGRLVLVGGDPAELVDTISAISSVLPVVIGLIVLLTFLLLLLLTGSVILPLKALLFNALSLGSVFGAMVWMFQDGHLANVVGVTPAPIAVAIPVLCFCVAFGLSMDYEVFLLSRIKERYNRTHSVAGAVRHGLGASGSVVSTAAGILALSFFAMVTSGVTPIKLFGLATGVAILLDAFLVRGVLLPATLKLLGRTAWWAPRAVQRLVARIDLDDGAGPDDAEAGPEHPLPAPAALHV